MDSAPKHVLVVAHNLPLQGTRVTLLRRAGYQVSAAVTDDQAMEMIEEEQFDLVLLGRKSWSTIKGIDQRIREKYPNLLTLKIQAADEIESVYPSRITNALPEHVLTAIREMLGLTSEQW